MKSRLLGQFVKEIKYENRNPSDTKVLELLNDKATNPERVLSIGTKIYRSRVVLKTDQIGVTEGFYGFSETESFIAPCFKTTDMRANYRFIPYLYCSNNPYTSLVEVRPRIGAKVSVATIELKEELRLLDLTVTYKPKNMSETKMNLFDDLSEMYSLPISEEDDIIEYVPTQYIAEYIKKLNYDGIIFSSSLTPEIKNSDLDMFNIVIFNYYKCKVTKSNLFSIDQSSFEVTQIDSDIKRISIVQPYLQMSY